MSYNENTAQMIGSQHEGIGPVNIIDKDWYKRLLKTALCSDAPMKVFSCTAIHKKEDLLTLQSSEDCKYVAGQSVTVTNTEDIGLSGTYVIVSSQLPDKFTIRVPSELSMPSSPTHVSLKTGNWTYKDIDANITDFFPRDYVAGEDYFIRLDNTPFIGLTTNATGRASEFMIMLDLEGDLIHINTNTKMALPTRFTPSKVFSAINPNLIQSRFKTWSIFFDHESVYFFSGIHFGINFSNGDLGSGGYAHADVILNADDLVPSDTTPYHQRSGMVYNMFNMMHLTGAAGAVTAYRDGLVAFCFAAIKPSSWYSDIPLLERRVYAAPSLALSKITVAAMDTISTSSNHPEYPNLKASALPVKYSNTTYDVMTRIAKFPGTTSIDSRVALEFVGGASTGKYPFHAKQIIGKEFYTIKSDRIPVGDLHGRVSITSNITKQLVPSAIKVDGGTSYYSLLGTPIEKYNDDSVLIGICRGISGGATVDGHSMVNATGFAQWDGMLIGGPWGV